MLPVPGSVTIPSSLGFQSIFFPPLSLPPPFAPFARARHRGARTLARFFAGHCSQRRVLSARQPSRSCCAHCLEAWSETEKGASRGGSEGKENSTLVVDNAGPGAFFLFSRPLRPSEFSLPGFCRSSTRDLDENRVSLAAAAARRNVAS